MVVETIFPGNPANLEELLEYLQRVHAVHGNIPIGSSAGSTYPHLSRVFVHVGVVGAGKGSLRQVSRGGRPCLVFC